MTPGLVARISLVALVGCSGGSADVARDPGHDVTAALDLGRLSPKASRRFAVDLEPLTVPAELVELASTCACADVGVTSEGQTVATGARLRSGARLRLQGVYRARQEGELHDTVTAYFAVHDRRLHRRAVRLRAVGDPASSRIVEKEVELLVAVPDPSEITVLELRKPLAPGSLRVVGLPMVVLDVLRQAESGEVGTVGLRVAHLTRTGVFEGHVELGLGEDLVERTPIRVRAYAPETLSPERLIARLPEDAYQEFPFALRGTRGAWSAECVTWEPESVVDGADSTRVTEAIEMSLVRAEGTVTGGEVRLKLCVRSKRTPGMYRGLALVRPYEGARHVIALPYHVRVTATEAPSAAEPGSSR